MKKAGLIIGIVVILLAVALFGVSQIVEKRNIEKITSAKNQTKQEAIPKKDKGTVKDPVIEKTEPIIIEKEVEKIVEKEVEKEVSGIKNINKASLGTVYQEKEGVVVIAEKRLILLDEDYDSTQGKMLTYCFDVLTTDNMKLVLFMTERAYNNYEVGDKLLVRYNVYKNANDILFPVVLSVDSVTD